MYIVISCLGLPFNGDTLKTKSLGGSETAAYYMAKGLVKQGHQVTLFTNDPTGGEFDGVRYTFAGPQTEDFPLGANFHFYAENTPHDVLIIQRHPQAFAFNWASKVNIWWVHDLALLRTKPAVDNMLWNIDAVVTVSKYHKQQICDVWKIKEDIVYPVINAVDNELFTGEPIEREPNSLIYTSRPERGLEWLVMPGGVMEKLPDHTLYVCGYDNVTRETHDYYRYLWQRCDELPNVINLGALTKQQLADKLRACEALVYPTPGPKQPNFEEVSCIAVMEAAAAGCAIVTTHVGALPETCGKLNKVVYAGIDEDGLPSVASFTNIVRNKHWLISAPDQEEKDFIYLWDTACSQMAKVARKQFSGRRSTDVLRHYVDYSDIKIANTTLLSGAFECNAITEHLQEEVEECYNFYFSDTFKEHYEKYYAYEEARGAIYGPESLDHNARFNHVSGLVSNLPSGCVVGDYGCAHGHYTINLAKRFPDKHFIGYDIAQSNIDKAKQWAADEGLQNVDFFRWSVGENGDYKLANHEAMLVCELLEHVAEPVEVLTALSPFVKTFICSTPLGPWEQVGYKEHWPWRAHIHHFERADIMDMFGHLENFSLHVVPSGQDALGRCLGSYVYSFELSGPVGAIRYDRKEQLTLGRQTVSLCMLVKDAEKTIESALTSCARVIDEVVIGLDETTTDTTHERVERFCKTNHLPLTTVLVKPPVDIGFDAARNATISKACGSWIFWLDSDEQLVNQNNLAKYLRHNEYAGYAVRQDHVSYDPPCILKKDLPVKLFRNYQDIKFIGRVHEHPEAEMNKGVGQVFLLPDVSISHFGYSDEPTRRGRFGRNMPLLERDRKDYPDRVLGKFLYLRDLAQLCGHEAETTGSIRRADLDERVKQGVELWLDLVKNENIRLVMDALPYYSALCKLSGEGFSASFKANFTKDLEASTEGCLEVTGFFQKQEHFEQLFNLVKREQVKDFDSRYL